MKSGGFWGAHLDMTAVPNQTDMEGRRRKEEKIMFIENSHGGLCAGGV